MSIISIDFGTSSLKTALLDDRVHIVATSSVPYQFDVEHNDWVTLSDTVLWEALRQGIQALGDTHDVSLVVYDAFSPSVVLMDERGEAIYPVITHLDRRAKEQSRQIQKNMGSSAFQAVTGLLPFTGGASVTTMMWFAQNQPELYEKASQIGPLCTWVYQKLTGVFATDPVNASQTGGYETITAKGWSESILNEIRLDIRKLPPVHQAGTIMGNLTENAAAWLGLKTGIPVALGSNDAAMAQVGAGNNHPGDILNIAGSSEMVSILTDQPIVHPRYYLRKAAQPGLWQFYATTIGGFALDWIKNQMFREMDKKQFFDELIPSLLQKDQTSSHVRFLPYLAGDRQSIQKKRGAFHGMTLDTTREDLLYAVLRGINDPIRDTIRLSSEILDINPVLKITGGLTRTAGYSEFKTRYFGVKEYQVIDDCPLIGNARLALQMMDKPCE